ncbi:hypothetical protein PR048_031794 [Dryococelus australis]|uniref:Uncharacterized protein n=1 Tax=Dryococelus australis TaxID=614101 RepID=A0ABQ9G6A0_9NEOP|nr:hypothetical protein PR048_031794 [Dryococelus australis]
MCVCARADGLIYALGGYNGRMRMSSAERYHPQYNQWQVIPPMNKQRSDASAAALHGKVSTPAYTLAVLQTARNARLSLPWTAILATLLATDAPNSRVGREKGLACSSKSTPLTFGSASLLQFGKKNFPPPGSSRCAEFSRFKQVIDEKQESGVQFPAGSPHSRKWESCRTMPLVGGFSRGSPVSTVPSFRRRSIFTSTTLIGSQDLAVKSSPNLFIHSFIHPFNKTQTSCCGGNTLPSTPLFLDVLLFNALQGVILDVLLFNALQGVILDVLLFNALQGVILDVLLFNALQGVILDVLLFNALQGVILDVLLFNALQGVILDVLLFNALQGVILDVLLFNALQGVILDVLLFNALQGVILDVLLFNALQGVILDVLLFNALQGVILDVLLFNALQGVTLNGGLGANPSSGQSCYVLYSTQPATNTLGAFLLVISATHHVTLSIDVAGGFNGTEVLSSVEVFDPVSLQWTLINPMSRCRSGVSLIAYEDRLYAMGGFDGSTRLDSGELCSTATVHPMFQYNRHDLQGRVHDMPYRICGGVLVGAMLLQRNSQKTTIQLNFHDVPSFARERFVIQSRYLPRVAISTALREMDVGHLFVEETGLRWCNVQTTCDPGSTPGGGPRIVACGKRGGRCCGGFYSELGLGIVLDDDTGRRVFSGISRFPHPCIPKLLHSHLIPPSSALKTSFSRASKTSSPHTFYISTDLISHEDLGNLASTNVTIRHFVNKFNHTESVKDEENSGRPSVPEYTVQRIQEAIDRNPRVQSLCLSSKLDVPQSTSTPYAI